jgi:kinesin family member 11
MQGDLNLSPLGNPVANAGMMPRVITNLYQRLETTGADFSVKISFVELYNEELRDLLAYEDAESQEGGSEVATLKIYDDAGKRGIFIQGLEEVLVKDAATAIKLLAQGSHRRQVAATKFNDHSRYVVTLVIFLSLLTGTQSLACCFFNNGACERKLCSRRRSTKDGKI